MTHVARKAEVGGVMLAYDDVGQGEAFLLVHGHPFNRSMWRHQIDHFSRSGWRVIAPDLRGYGGSTVVAGKTTLERFARDLAELLDHLRLERAILAGVSMGGQIVMEFHRLVKPHEDGEGRRWPRRSGSHQPRGRSTALYLSSNGGNPLDSCVYQTGDFVARRTCRRGGSARELRGLDGP